MKFVIQVGASIIVLLSGSDPAVAQQRYPERPVKVIVAFAPGGNNDVPVRMVTARLSEMWRVGVPVDNKAGAGGVIGSDFVAKAQADGYTLLNCNSATHGTSPALNRKIPYDPVRSFAAVALIGAAPNVVIVPANSPLKSIQEFLQAARNKSKNLAVGTAGNGSTQHFSLELLKSALGVEMVHVPYKGGSQALADLMGAQVPAAITGLPTAISAIKAGKVRALAVTSSQRSNLLPDVPTLAESGVPGYEVTTWTGFCAPAGTPQRVIEQLNADVKRAVESAETRQQLITAGVEPVQMSPKAFADLIERDVKRFANIVESAGIAADL